MSGRQMIRDLVFSRSSGKKSVIVRVLVERDGKVAARLGVSALLDVFSERIEAALSLPANPVFFHAW
jgi:hypothetical protein